MVYLEVCKFKKKNTSLENIFFTKNSATGMSCANLKVVVFFLSEISSRGAKVPLKINENIINFKALPIFLPKGDSWGFSTCHS